MTQYDGKPFDPSDPFDSLADELRQKIAEVGVWFVEDERCAAMTEVDRFVYYVAGALTGVMGVVHGLVHEDSQDSAAELVRVFIASAAENARDIVRGAN